MMKYVYWLCSIDIICLKNKIKQWERKDYFEYFRYFLLSVAHFLTLISIIQLQDKSIWILISLNRTFMIQHI